MKTLVLVRHAKSDWGNSMLSDFDRPLNKRGMNDAPLMAGIIAELGIKPDCIFTSAANRAQTTARFFAKHFGINDDRFNALTEIYNGGMRDYINIINEANNKYDTVLLFGHNPEITILASQFVSQFSEHIPTAGCFAIDFDINDWLHIESGKGKLRFFEYPKNYK